jgi:anthranilate phosphoribosyltransferase
LRGGDTVEESARQLKEILQNIPGPRRDMVLLNSGAALMAAGRAADLATGVDLARRIIESGAALAKLEALVSFTGK